jgi:hypothetical protein
VDVRLIVYNAYVFEYLYLLISYPQRLMVMTGLLYHI